MSKVAILRQSAEQMTIARQMKRALYSPVALQRKIQIASRQLRSFWRGSTWGNRNISWNGHPISDPCPAPSSLRDFFNARKTGNGIWKYTHYFDVYEKHFAPFRGREVNVLEIGIYSGGSLEMWRDYFGPKARLYGVDIQEACTVYESDLVKVFIGDQGDRKFWQRFKREVPTLDIVIDDGSHHPDHQIITFEELVPHMQPGGVYFCEDVTKTNNAFASYIFGFARNLYSFEPMFDFDNLERRTVSPATPFQSTIHSINLYPYLIVVEKNIAPLPELVCPKHGTEWQPFMRQKL